MDRFQHIELDALDGEREEPTDEVRAAVTEFGGLPGWGPHRIHAFLESRGHRATVAQVRGAMAGL